MQPKIIFSKRKTVALMVTRDAQVIVRAPHRTPRGFIDRFISEKESWIIQALQRRSQNRKTYQEGEMFLYLGKQYPLRYIEGYRSRLEFAEAFYISKHKSHAAQKLLEDWYKEQAKRIITDRTKYFSGMMSLKYKHISVKNMSSRWGSCSSLGNLNFNFRLVLAPIEILDYVVVHELAHLTHKNHSARFWQLVGQYHQTPEQCRRWLRKNGSTLVL